MKLQLQWPRNKTDKSVFTQYIVWHHPRFQSFPNDLISKILSRITDWGKKTRASNKDPLSKSNCIFPFCPLSINFCYFPLNGVQELFPRHPLKSYLDSRASCEMLSLKYISPYKTTSCYIATSILLFSTTTRNLCNLQTFSAYSNLAFHFSLKYSHERWNIW